MDLHRMIAELQAERERLDEAIQALERLSAGKVRRRGRPPRWLNDEIRRQAAAAAAAGASSTTTAESREESPAKPKKT